MSAPRLLIIDDEQDFLTTATMRLRAEFGYAVLAANDPDEGIRRAKAERPDLILLDLAMPKIDGYEVMKLLHADEATRDIPIIVLTSHGAERFRKKSLDWGADAFVAKDALELSTYLRRGKSAQDIPLARKDILDYRILDQVIQKVLTGDASSE